MMLQRFSLLVVTVVLFSSSLNADSPTKLLRAGAAKSNLTPPLGSAIIGGFAPYPAKHVHDELHARCLVLDDGQTKLALVICDLLGLHRLVSEEARKLIEQSTGIPKECVLIAGTHTHSAASALGEDRFRNNQTLDDYQKFAAQRIADGVRSAVNTLRPAELAFGSIDVPEHLFNRRWYLKEGTMPENPFGKIDKVKMNPGSGPNLVEPAGPTDPQVSIISVREPDGKPISVFTAYSLHYVGGVGDGHISADYFAVYSEAVARALKTDEFDPPFVAMMSNGTSGDINNINFKTPRPGAPPYHQMRAVANDLAAKVTAKLPELKHRSDIRLGARYREPVLKWRKPNPEERAWAVATLEKPEVPGKTDLSRIYAERTMRLSEYPETTPVPLQVLVIGDACLGTMPCEVFCEIGLEFRERSPIKPAFMVSLNHGYFGYLPTPRHHELGGYETWIGTNRLERDASVRLLDELVEMAGELQPNGKAK
jgi:neutral ceramidase